jgi:hypothetical protein
MHTHLKGADLGDVGTLRRNSRPLVIWRAGLSTSQLQRDFARASPAPRPRHTSPKGPRAIGRPEP